MAQNKEPDLSGDRVHTGDWKGLLDSGTASVSTRWDGDDHDWPATIANHSLPNLTHPAGRNGAEN